VSKIELEFLKTIQGLDIPKDMSDKESADFYGNLDNFVDTLSEKSHELTKLFVASDYFFLRKKLVELELLLGRIRASDAAAKCHDLINTVIEGENDEIDIYLGKLISELNTLSIDIQMAQHKSKEERKKRWDQTTETRKNILAVDDMPVLLNTLKGVIDGEKYKFSGLTSGKAALKYLDTHTPPDLFIVDIEMPEMDGYELAKNIAARGYNAPIIFLTNNATRDAVIRALKAGATDFLVKPVDEELLLERLEQYLG